MSAPLERLRGGFILSIQPSPASALNDPAIIAAFARCARANGAAGVRIEGAARIAAVARAVDVPVIGLIKRRNDGFETYITTALEDVDAVVDAGASVVAFDATGRSRCGGATVATLVARTHARGALAMADCATADDGGLAVQASADIVATTLAGYTPHSAAVQRPAHALTASLAALHPFVVTEGGVGDPAQVRLSFEAGASAVVAGTAITDIDAIVRTFVAATPGFCRPGLPARASKLHDVRGVQEE